MICRYRATSQIAASCSLQQGLLEISLPAVADSRRFRLRELALVDLRLPPRIYRISRSVGLNDIVRNVHFKHRYAQGLKPLPDT